MKSIDLRVQKTHMALIQAFQTLISQKEFDKITVNELCDLALIRRPTFYKHFLDKYDFLSFFIKTKMSDIFNQALKESYQTTVSFFTRAFELILDQHHFFQQVKQHITINPDLLNELEPVRQFGEELLSQQVHIAGVANNQLELSYRISLLIGITLNSVMWYEDNQDKISREEMVTKYQDTLQQFLNT